MKRVHLLLMCSILLYMYTGSLKNKESDQTQSTVTHASTSKDNTYNDLVKKVHDSVGQSNVNRSQSKSRSIKYLGNNILEYITLSIPTLDHEDKKIERDALLMIRPKAEATVLICHGFMCDKYDIGFLRFIFSDYNVMTFDFRAHGAKADGQCCTFGAQERLDVRAAVECIKNHAALKDKPLIVYGFSMGAAASILAQAEDPTLFEAMILDCPFDSTDNILERGLSEMKFNLFGYEMPLMSLPGSSYLKSYAYTPYVQAALKYFLKTIAKLDASQVVTCIEPVSPVEDIKKVTVPCLIIGCINDEKVPVKALLQVFNNAGSDNVKCWITKGVRHYDSVFHNPELYAYKVNQFIKKLVRGSLRNTNRRKILYDDPAWKEELKKKEEEAQEASQQTQLDTLQKQIHNFGPNALKKNTFGPHQLDNFTSITLY